MRCSHFMVRNRRLRRAEVRASGEGGETRGQHGHHAGDGETERRVQEGLNQIGPLAVRGNMQQERKRAFGAKIAWEFAGCQLLRLPSVLSPAPLRLVHLHTRATTIAARAMHCQCSLFLSVTGGGGERCQVHIDACITWQQLPEKAADDRTVVAIHGSAQRRGAESQLDRPAVV